MNVGKSEIASLESIGKFLVIESEQMQDRGVQVVNVDRVFLDTPADLVGAADGLSPFHSSTRHPETERVGVVVASG